MFGLQPPRHISTLPFASDGIQDGVRQPNYSITSSARASSIGGTSMPSALAGRWWHRAIESEVRQETLAAGIAQSNLSKLHQIGLAPCCVLVDAFQMGRVPPADEIEFGGPARRSAADKTDGLDE